MISWTKWAIAWIVFAVGGRYWSFDAGNVHFVGLESDIPLDGTQRAWLESDLAGALHGRNPGPKGN